MLQHSGASIQALRFPAERFYSSNRVWRLLLGEPVKVTESLDSPSLAHTSRVPPFPKDGECRPLGNFSMPRIQRGQSTGAGLGGNMRPSKSSKTKILSKKRTATAQFRANHLGPT
jgi:hypothetical protein